MIDNIELECPGCGRPVSIGQKECACGRPILISTFNSLGSMSILEVNKYANSFRKALNTAPENKDINRSAGLCFLKLKMYDAAISALDVALKDNFDDPEAFFYASVCRLRGKKAFMASRMDIDKIVELMNAAIMIEPRGIFYFFLAYIKYDYFERKYLNTSPDYKSLLADAKQAGYSELDVTQLFDLLNTTCPEALI